MGLAAKQNKQQDANKSKSSQTFSRIGQGFKKFVDKATPNLPNSQQGQERPRYILSSKHTSRSDFLAQLCWGLQTSKCPETQRSKTKRVLDMPLSWYTSYILEKLQTAFYRIYDEISQTFTVVKSEKMPIGFFWFAFMIWHGWKKEVKILSYNPCISITSKLRIWNSKCTRTYFWTGCGRRFDIWRIVISREGFYSKDIPNFFSRLGFPHEKGLILCRFNVFGRSSSHRDKPEGRSGAESESQNLDGLPMSESASLVSPRAR